MKYYEVHNYVNGNEYVNEDSDITSEERVWTTDIPWNFNPDIDNVITPPYKFNNRGDAIRIKDALQSVRMQHYKESRFYVVSRERSPKWKVYTFETKE
jgi:hypothetical protein